MATYKSQVDNITQYKTSIKSAIEAMGQSVTTLATYAQAIRNISTDADAEPQDIFIGKTAYVNGHKIVGTLQLTDLATDSVSAADIVASGDSWIFHGYNGTTSRGIYVRTVNGAIPFSISASNSVLATKFGVTADKIKEGVTILGVAGTVTEGIDTSDATASAGDILEGQTAYVNGEKLTGTIPVREIITDSLGQSDITYTNNNLYFHGYSNASNGIYLSPRSGQVRFNITCSDSTMLAYLGLTPDKIKKGVRVLNIVGTYEGEST